jgi:hypothetical protein
LKSKAKALRSTRGDNCDFSSPCIKPAPHSQEALSNHAFLRSPNPKFFSKKNIRIHIFSVIKGKSRKGTLDENVLFVLSTEFLAHRED